MTERPEAEDAVRMVTEDVVTVGGQVMGLDELRKIIAKINTVSCNKCNKHLKTPNPNVSLITESVRVTVFTWVGDKDADVKPF